jgi:hypothetical protein
MHTPFRLLAAAFALVASAAAQSHEFWMLPGRFESAVGQAALLQLSVGQEFVGDHVPFSPELVAGLWRFSADGRAPLSATRAMPALAVRLPSAGSHVVALDTHPSFIELPADKFTDYLRLEGLQSVIDWRAQHGAADLPGRERYRRNVKALLRAGPASDGTFAVRTGQRLEIVPRSDPWQAHAPAALAFEVTFDGTPLPHALLKLWHHGSSGLVKLEAVTGADGRAAFVLPQAGAWMASVVQMIAATDTPGIDWDSYWGNLTFEIPPAGAGSMARR